MFYLLAGAVRIKHRFWTPKAVNNMQYISDEVNMDLISYDCL